MSAVRLRRIRQEYRNERYSIISGIFLPQQELNSSACVPCTFLSCTATKMGVAEKYVCKFAVIEFVVKEGKCGRSHIRANSLCV